MRNSYLLITALLALSPVSAHADPILISTSIGNYEITTETGTFAELVNLLDDQPWWTNVGFDTLQLESALAEEFALAVGDQLNTGSFAPLFAFDAINTFILDLGTFQSVLASQYPSSEIQAVDWSITRTWAIATEVIDPVTVPEPSTFALLGIGLVSIGLRRRKP